jgi:hypothetical protein
MARLGSCDQLARHLLKGANAVIVPWRMMSLPEQMRCTELAETPACRAIERMLQRLPARPRTRHLGDEARHFRRRNRGLATTPRLIGKPIQPAAV